MISLLGTEAAVAESGGFIFPWSAGPLFSLGLMTTLGSLVRAQQSTSSYVCEPVDQSIKRLYSPLWPFSFWLGHCRSGFGDCAGPSGGRHPLVAKVQLPFAPLVGIGS